VALGLLLPVKAAGIVLKETGSTLLYPLFQRWIRDYPAAAPGVTLTAAATGSGTGEKEAMAGQAQIGASDAYLSEEEAEQNQGIKNIPVAISAQTVNFNIPSLKGTRLKLDGQTLAAIYTGRITEWDAAPIKAMNPDVDLPHQTIVPIRREDASGDTFIFTQFLALSTQSWSDKIGYGKTVDWPAVPGERTGAAMRTWSRRRPRRPIRLPISASAFTMRLSRPGSAPRC
jgi:phosphate transport system substrate-binding protein